MGTAFQKATKHESKLRMALFGPSGSGKTFTALVIAQGLGGKTAVIDTEHGSASKYADKFDFDVCELDSFGPETYIDTIAAAEAAGYDNLVIDSLSHAWVGKDGALEQVDRAAKRSQGNSFAGWRDVTPLHNRLIDAMISSKCHIIATMRSKTEYLVEKNEQGRSAPRKVGLAPVQRDGMEYEFDITGEMTQDNELIVGKTRCTEIAGKVYTKPDGKMVDVIKAWLSGAPVEPPKLATKDQLMTLGILCTERIDAGVDIHDAISKFLKLDPPITSRKELQEAQADKVIAFLRTRPLAKKEAA